MITEYATSHSKKYIVFKLGHWHPGVPTTYTTNDHTSSKHRPPPLKYLAHSCDDSRSDSRNRGAPPLPWIIQSSSKPCTLYLSRLWVVHQAVRAFSGFNRWSMLYAAWLLNHNLPIMLPEYNWVLPVGVPSPQKTSPQLLLVQTRRGNHIRNLKRLTGPHRSTASYPWIWLLHRGHRMFYR